MLFYLANDVVQNSRKKSKELIQYFGKAFRETIPYMKYVSMLSFWFLSIIDLLFEFVN